MTGHDERADAVMEQMLERAEREDLWFHRDVYRVALSPEELRAARARGDFPWDPGCWSLRPPPPLETEVYVVATNRRDGGLPAPAKAVGRDGIEVHHVLETALALKERTIAENGPYYGVYRALLRIEGRVDAPDGHL